MHKLLFWPTSAVSSFLIFDYMRHTDAKIHYLISHVLRQIDPENAHKLSLFCSSLINFKTDNNSVECTILGHKLKSPIGIAAGFSKNGEALNQISKMGFGLIEIGSITPASQEGNDKPRVFRIEEDGAVVNRYGFNSDGHDVVKSRLQGYRTPRNVLFGINLGKNKIPQYSSHDDYNQGIQTFSKYADYLVINVSSPNTPGLRALQSKKQLKELFAGLITDGTSPILLKVAPDLTNDDITDICEVVKETPFIKGLIIGNTTITRPNSSFLNYNERGGLSGKPLYPIMKSTLIKFTTQLKHEILSKKLEIIGCGGISTSDQIIELAELGCCAVQLYSSMVYNGINLIPKLNSEILLKLNGRDWNSIVGSKL
eukprot:NODE_165_length_14629_cov_0.605231.p4 type:complete len:370 gc:universal NODE_165_length_14629_cov_0.605231:12465-13574(+)